MVKEGTVYVTSDTYGLGSQEYNEPYRAAEIVKNQLEFALDTWDGGSDVSVGNEIFFPDSSDNTLTDYWHHMERWIAGDDGTPPSSRSRDFNLLVMTDDELDEISGNIGFGYICGYYPNKAKASVCRRAENIINLTTSPERYGYAAFASDYSLQSFIHEAGHNLGGLHRHGMRYWMDDGMGEDLYNTPFGSDTWKSGEENCGPTVEEKHTRLDRIWAGCTWDVMDSCSPSNPW
jgi:hypothetical protein